MKRNKFKGKSVYFSGTIRGAVNVDPEFSYQIVQYMISEGIEVLDKGAAGRNNEEKRQMFIEEHGFDPLSEKNVWTDIEEIDIGLVDRATHLVAVVDNPSLGVGNEIQRAIDNNEFGRRKIEVLCLIHEDRLENLSWMIRGKQRPKYPSFHLETYKDLKEAKAKVAKFLTTR